MLDRTDEPAPGDYATARIQNTYFDSADLCLADAGRFVVRSVAVTVRSVDDVPGWVGLVEADLSRFAGEELELRTTGDAARCRVMFPADRSLVRGSGIPPQEIAPAAQIVPS